MGKSAVVTMPPGAKAWSGMEAPASLEAPLCVLLPMQQILWFDCTSGLLMKIAVLLVCCSKLWVEVFILNLNMQNFLSLSYCAFILELHCKNYGGWHFVLTCLETSCFQHNPLVKASIWNAKSVPGCEVCFHPPPDRNSSLFSAVLRNTTTTSSLAFVDLYVKSLNRVCSQSIIQCALLFRRIMYWSEIGGEPQIEQAGMDGSSRKVLIDRGLGWPISITLDLLSWKIFWADDKLHCIGSASLDGTGMQVPCALWTLLYLYPCTKSFVAFPGRIKIVLKEGYLLMVPIFALLCFSHKKGFCPVMGNLSSQLDLLLHRSSSWIRSIVPSQWLSLRIVFIGLTWKLGLYRR